jgi:probable F420-dependent oxidoreductase
VAQRDPIVTAKEVASLDVLSGGRFLFGVGAGWLKEEMILMGADYPRRWAQVKDKIAAMKRIWMADEASHSGEFVRFPAIKAEPKPVQKPHPPIHLGGNHPHSFRRVGEWADGWIPLRITPEEAKSGREKIAEHARSTGRDGSRIEVSIFGGPPDQAAQRAYGEAGVDRYVVFVPSHGPGDMERELSKLARELGLGR